jgi:hypothetical protein
MARSTQRLWRASTPLGWISELGLAGAGPVAILAGFSLAAAITLIQPDRSWAQDAALVLFCVAVAVLVLALRLIITAQFYLSVPSDYLTWRPEAARNPHALREERDRQTQDYLLYMYYRKRAVRAVPVGVACALLGLAFACLNGLARHTGPGSAYTGSAAALVLGAAAVIAFLEVFDRPQWLFPNGPNALARIASSIAKKRAEQEQSATRGQLIGTAGQSAGAAQRPPTNADRARATTGPPDPESSLPPELQLLPMDLPAITTALGDEVSSPPLLTPSARTIQELKQLLPSEMQQTLFQVACQRLALAFGNYSTTRTSVLFAVVPDDDPREQVAVAIHPAWAELLDAGVPFVAKPEVLARRNGASAASIEQELAHLPPSPLWAESRCRLLTNTQDVDRLIALVQRP